MRFGEAYKILENIDSERYTAEEKGTAIMIGGAMAGGDGK